MPEAIDDNDIIHNRMEPSPGRQKSGADSVDLLPRLHCLWVVGEFLSRHPIIFPLGTFWVGAGQREGSDREGAFVFC